MYVSHDNSSFFNLTIKIHLLGNSNNGSASMITHIGQMSMCWYFHYGHLHNIYNSMLPKGFTAETLNSMY